MSRLEWDTPETRQLEHGLSHGVLYYGGVAYAWSGLTAIEDTSTPRFSSIYVDGYKVADAEQSPDYGGVLRCLTYPKIFDYILGMENDYAGVSHSVAQYGRMFGLSFRTKVVDGNGKEHELVHLLYNLHATPDTQQYASYSNQPTVTDFAFKLTGIPTSFANFAPAVHYILDTSVLSTDKKTILYNTLYGQPNKNATLPSPDDIYDALHDLKELRTVKLSTGVIVIESNEMRFLNEDEEGLVTIDYPTVTAVGTNLIDFETEDL